MTRTFHRILFLAMLTVPLVADAASNRIEIPLSGHGGYRAAKGHVKFSEIFGTRKDDGTTLEIEVSNVPLPSGTELIVYVHEVEVGKIKLNKERSGRLVLESKKLKAAPRVNPGSFVTLKLEDGTTVIW
jgi:hypothetical protein